MGYYTDFEIQITGFDESEGADERKSPEWFAFKVRNFFWGEHVFIHHERASISLADAKWYDWQKDLLDVSEDFPELLLEVTGNGEDSDDNWKARIKNGKIETVKAELVYPEFQHIGVTQ